MTSGVISHFLRDELRANKKSSIEERSGSKGRLAGATTAFANSTGINQNYKADLLANKLSDKIDSSSSGSGSGSGATNINSNNSSLNENKHRAKAHATKSDEEFAKIGGGGLLAVANGHKFVPAKNRKSSELREKERARKTLTDKTTTTTTTTTKNSKVRRQIKASEWCKRLLVGACKQVGAKVVILKGSMISSSGGSGAIKSNSNNNNHHHHHISKPMIGDKKEIGGEANESASSTSTQSQFGQTNSAAAGAASASATGTAAGKTNTSRHHLISEFSWRLVERCRKAKVVQFASRASGFVSNDSKQVVKNSGSSRNNNFAGRTTVAAAAAAAAASTKNCGRSGGNKTNAVSGETKDSSSSKQATSGGLGLSFAKSFVRRRRKIESDLQQQRQSSLESVEVAARRQQLFSCERGVVENSSDNNLSVSSSSMAATSAFDTPTQASHRLDADQSSIATIPVSTTTTTTATTTQLPPTYTGGFITKPNQLGKLGGQTNSSVSTITSDTTTTGGGGGGLICCQYCQEHCQADYIDKNSLHESGCFVSSSALGVGSGSNSCGLTNCSDSITTQHSSQSSSSASNSTNNNYNELSSVVEYTNHLQEQEQEQQLVVKAAAAAKPSSTCDLKSAISGHFLSETSSPVTPPASFTTSTMFLETQQQEVATNKFTPTSTSSTSIFKNNNNATNRDGGGKKKQGSFLSRARDSTINLSSLANVTRSFGYSTSVGNLWSSHSQQRKELAELSGDSPRANVRPLDIVAQAAFDSDTFSPSFHKNNINNNNSIDNNDNSCSSSGANVENHQNGCEKATKTNTSTTTTTNAITKSSSSNKLSVAVEQPESVSKSESQLQSPTSTQTHHIMSTKEKEWRQKEAEKMEKLRLLVTYLKNGRGADILPINKTTSACTNPQNFAVWIDNEVNSLINDLEVKSQLLKNGKDHAKGGKLKWLSPSSRRSSSGAHST